MSQQKAPIRALIAIPGFDGHWKGAMTVSMALRDAGAEVIYVGNQTPKSIAEIAIQEDVDVIGLSIFAAGHMKLIPQTASALNDKGAKDILLIVGGIIPPDDVPKLKEIGVDEIFLPGGKIEEVVNYVFKNAGRKRKALSTR